MMYITQRMEQFSKAYVRAVVSCAGFQVCSPEVDDDSIDGQIVSREGRRPRLEFQLKATCEEPPETPEIAFPLPIKNYDDLRQETIVPRILIVLMMPSGENDWLRQSEAELALRRCAYWRSLHGEPDVENATNKTVKIRRAQMFSVEQVREIMARVDRGEKP
jgi:hypothetical protein